jgi:hypothetical protein
MIESFLAPWFERAVLRHDEVTDSEAIDRREVRVFRKRLDPITVVPLTSDYLERDDIEAVLADNRPTIVVLVNKNGHYEWAARELAESHDSSVQTYGELFSFLGDPDPRPGVDKKVAFVVSRIRQHRKVRQVEMICEAMMRVRRIDGLRSLLVSVESHYEFTEEAMVQALARHADVDIVYNGNPNGTITEAAHAHAKHAGVEVLGFGDLMRRLHREN